jgi:hypothetical protein
MTPEIEERLRGALAARADQITAVDLQPAAPPSLLSSDRTGGVRSGGRLHFLGGRWVPAVPFLGGRWAPALAGVAVAAVAVVFAVLLAWHPRQSSPPGRAPYLPGDVPASAPASSRPGPANEQPQPLPDMSPPLSPAPPANSLPTGPPAILPTGPPATLQTGGAPNAATSTVSAAPSTTAPSDPETVPPNVVPS